jgi:D-serine deaminase-like pyridoxal phosphate-dependent protein
MDDLSTPAFLVDRDIVTRNCDRMRAKAERSGVAFRPHVKTHKVAEIGRLQHGGAAGPITVSTLAEAEHFAAAGFGDITYAVPIAPAKLERAAALGRAIERLNILVDSQAALQAVESFAGERPGTVFDVFLKVDCGYHRAGVDPSRPESVQLALALSRSSAVRFRGLLTHAGHSYNSLTTAEVLAIAKQETAAVTNFAATLAQEGAGELVRSIGSTPTCTHAESFTDCDEVRPGNYVFFDAFQATLGSCSMSDVAVSVLTTVVGCYPDREELIVDAAALALSKDPGPNLIDPTFGYGLVCDLELRPQPLKLIALSQEHGKIEVEGNAARWPVGTRLRIVPNHSCLTAAMYDRYAVLSAGQLVDEWRPVRGW